MCTLLSLCFYLYHFLEGSRNKWIISCVLLGGFAECKWVMGDWSSDLFVLGV